MTGRGGRQGLRELAERARALPGGDAERIGLASMAWAAGGGALELALLTACVRAVRRGWGTRGGGVRATVHAASSRPLVVLACSWMVYRTLGRFVLVRWTRRTVRRSERNAAAAPPA
jgi:hypothetical protein